MSDAFILHLPIGVVCSVVTRHLLRLEAMTTWAPMVLSELSSSCMLAVMASRLLELTWIVLRCFRASLMLACMVVLMLQALMSRAAVPFKVVSRVWKVLLLALRSSAKSRVVAFVAGILQWCLVLRPDAEVKLVMHVVCVVVIVVYLPTCCEFTLT